MRSLRRCFLGPVGSRLSLDVSLGPRDALVSSEVVVAAFALGPLVSSSCPDGLADFETWFGEWRNHVAQQA